MIYRINFRGMNIIASDDVIDACKIPTGLIQMFNDIWGKDPEIITYYDNFNIILSSENLKTNEELFLKHEHESNVQFAYNKDAKGFKSNFNETRLNIQTNKWEI